MGTNLLYSPLKLREQSRECSRKKQREPCPGFLRNQIYFSSPRRDELTRGKINPRHPYGIPTRLRKRKNTTLRSVGKKPAGGTENSRIGERANRPDGYFDHQPSEAWELKKLGKRKGFLVTHSVVGS